MRLTPRDQIRGEGIGRGLCCQLGTPAQRPAPALLGHLGLFAWNTRATAICLSVWNRAPGFDEFGKHATLWVRGIPDAVARGAPALVACRFRDFGVKSGHSSPPLPSPTPVYLYVVGSLPT